MRYFSIFCLLIVSVSCKKDESLSYPKSYTYHSTQQNHEGLFLVSHNNRVIPISLETGSYKTFKEDLKLEVAEAMQMIFDIHEIELLNENTVHIHLTIDEMIIDTVVSYTLEDGDIIIEALHGNDLFSYNADEDQFELCSRTQFALPGPNVLNPGQEYNQFGVSECLVDHDPEAYAQLMLDEIGYQPLDTLGVFITKFIYNLAY